MAKEKTMKIKLISFGYKYGSPDNVNYLWDVRFLPNPYWVDELRSKTGSDHDVSDYVIGSSEGHGFIKQLKPFLNDAFFALKIVIITITTTNSIDLNIYLNAI